MTPLPDPNVLAKAVRTVAAENPHKLVIQCLYVINDAEPSCIIGAALFKLGYTTDWYENTRSGDVNLVGITELYRLNNTIDNADTIVWLGTVQGFQDTPYEWAEAVRMADTELGVTP